MMQRRCRWLRCILTLHHCGIHSHYPRCHYQYALQLGALLVWNAPCGYASSRRRTLHIACMLCASLSVAE